MGRRLGFASVLAIWAAVGLFAAPGAQGMEVPQHLQSADVTGDIWYSFDQSFDDFGGFTRSDFYKAVLAWEVQSLTSYVNFTNDQLQGAPRYVAVYWIDGPYDPDTGTGATLAEANFPCFNNAVSCYIAFDAGESNWNPNDIILPNDIDFIGVAAHELGHWMGLDHWNAGVSSDGGSPSTPTMSESIPPGQTYARTISQDDANGIHVARPRFHIMTANDSFEFPNASPSGVFTGWKFVPGPSGGSATRYCNNSGYNSPCAVQYNGGGGSGAYIYQGIFNDGAAQKTGLRGKARLRNRGTVTSTVKINVVNTDANVVLASATCSLVPTQSGGPWTTCTTPYFNQPTAHPGGMHIRVINQSNSNFDVDTMIIEW